MSSKGAKKTESSSSHLKSRSNSRKSDALSTKQVEYELRTRVQELESEVKTLKLKLDELRKAKNTMLIKREKEFVTTGIPQRQSNETTSTKNGNDSEIEELKLNYQKNINELNLEIESLKLANTSITSNDTTADCEHEQVIIALQSRLSEVESANTALAIQNEQLQEKLTQSYNEISRKEAEHCELQESMKVDLQKKWQEMYSEWMKTTEAKISELQAANDMLRRMLGASP